MDFNDLQDIMSVKRMERFNLSMGSNPIRAAELYKSNLLLSRELFTVVGCFEVALRNRIDRLFISRYGNDWLRDSAAAGGMFDNQDCVKSKELISSSYRKLGTLNYTHAKLIAEMDFGFWRYLFAGPQYIAAQRCLLQVFPFKPRSTREITYNQRFVFLLLGEINSLRNRLAHHEPVCFILGQPIKNTAYSRRNYNLIIQVFSWMGINGQVLLDEVADIVSICNEIDAL
ncbi:MAG: CAAX protease [Bacteroidota bacterium]